MPTEREYFEEFRETSFATAHERGCEIVLASPSQIQLDIDKPWPEWANDKAEREKDEILWVLNILAATAGDRVREVLVVLLNFVAPLKWEAWRSSSGNTHIMIAFAREFTLLERIALQAILGSDPMRELLNLRRCWCEAEDPIALFRPAILAEVSVRG